MRRAVFLGIWLTLLLLQVNFLQGQSYVMTDGQTVTVNCSQTPIYFYDPGGPNGNYADSLHIVQTFKLEDGFTGCLKLAFTFFEVEESFYDYEEEVDYYLDYLAVYDGNDTNAPLIGTYANDYIPDDIYSTSGALTFVFHSNASSWYSYAGWAAVITCADCPPPSPEYMHNGIDTVLCSQSPRYFYDSGGPNGDYGYSSHYTQTFVSSDSTKCLSVTFTSFSTESSYDELLVYDGTSTSGIFLGSYSGTLSDFTVTSYTGGALTFVFHSDNTVNSEGWVAQINCIDCPSLPPAIYMHNGTETVNCSQTPMLFYDNGGSGDYSNSSNDTLILYPSSSGCRLAIFGTYNTETTYDYLGIYSGAGVSGMPLTTLGGVGAVTVPIVSTSPSGALTMVFHSDGSVVRSGFEFMVHCVCDIVKDTTCVGTPYQEHGFDTVLLTTGWHVLPKMVQNGIWMAVELYVLPKPVMSITGNSYFCATDSITLTASSAASYQWNTGATTQSITVQNVGVYRVTVTDSQGCRVIATHTISPIEDFIESIQIPKMCAGEDYLIKGSYHAGSEIEMFHIQSTLSIADTAFLPDGVPCAPNGCSYRSTLTFTDYSENAEVESVDDIYYVKINMEHSFIGDIYINITCPNGQKADIMRWSGSGSTECSSQIPQSSRNWQTGTNASGGTFFGEAYDYGATDKCDRNDSLNAPGIGWNYCWSNNTSEGYVYAADGGLVYRSANVHYNASVSNSVVDSSNVAAGIQFYHPDESFESLIGCPLNGDWYIQVMDGWGIDNGYVFSWELALTDELFTNSGFDVDSIVPEALWTTVLTDTSFVISPPADLPHDTVVDCTLHFYSSDGCSFDTIVPMGVFVPHHEDTTITTCNPVTFQGVTYSQSGDYTFEYTSVSGCDSTLTLHLSIHDPEPELVEATACGSYTWADGNGQTYTSSGSYTYSHTDANGCTQVDTLHLTIHNPIHNAITIAECGSYTWADGNGQTYTTSGTYTYSHEDANGCTQVDTLHLTIHNPTNQAFIETACESYTWNGTTYTSSGDYTYSHDDANGCTQVDTLHLTIHNPTNLGFTETAYDSYTWTDGTGETYTQSGTYYYSHTDGNGCAQVDTLYLTVYYSSSNEFAATACESYTWDGRTYTESGDHVWTYHDDHGADSVVTLHLTINHGTHNTESLSTCEDHTWHGTTYTESGDYTYDYTNAEGCPSTDTLHLTLFHPIHTAVTETACESFTWNGTIYTESGDYTNIHEDANGCTQVDTLHLTIHNPTNLGYTETAYDSYTWTDGNGETYSQSGTYYHEHTDANGCMQIDTLYLTVYYSSADEFSVTACESYEWDGETYTQSDDYSREYQDIHGADSIVTLHLTIHHGTHNAESLSACESFSWYGTTYTESGTYIYEYTNTDNCPSVDTLHLTVFHPVHTAFTETSCGNFAWNGTVYTQSGDYTYSHLDANGCTQVDTLHLTVHNPTHTVLTETVCENFLWNGTTYTQSGDYMFAHEDANGCQQVDTLHLTINHATSQDIYDAVCLHDEYDDYGFYITSEETGTAGAVIVHTHYDIGANECDSVTVLHLTVKDTVLRHIYDAVCLQDEYDNYGFFVSSEETGTAGAVIERTHHDMGANECDSVTVLHLTVKDTVLHHIYDEVCFDYDYDNYGFFVASEETGTAGAVIERTHHDIGSNECDSVTVLHLTVKDTVLRHIYDEVCFNTAYDLYGFSLTPEETAIADGSLEQHNIDMGSNECDSITVLHLTILHPEHLSYTETAIDSYVWTSGNGNTYVQSGTYYYVHTDANGCTQVDTLYLTVYYSSANVFSAVACEGYEWHDSIYTETGSYEWTFADQYGADSTVTLHLIVNHGTHDVETITACDSYVWHSTTYTESGVYNYDYVNAEGCPSADTLYLTVVSTPTVSIAGPQFFCPDSSVTLTAVTSSEPLSYLWSNGATTASIVVSETGAYTVTAYFANGCFAESEGFHVFESENPIMNALLHDMVAGDTQTVVIGTMPLDTVQGSGLQYSNPQSTLFYSKVTFLPDGVSCEPLGCSYRAEMVFEGFSDSAVIHSADEIRYIRLNIEHSAPIDLYINLTCPNGQQADILKKHDDPSSSDCLASIDASHRGWPAGNVDYVYNYNWPHIKARMGNPNILIDDYNNRCDSAVNPPGVGWNYCWSDNTTEGYQYASANGCLVDTSNAIYYYSGGIQELYYLQKIVLDSTNVAAGTQYYHPDESFDSLIGCPVNGIWTVEVIDGTTNDNGYIFECEMGVAEHLASEHYLPLAQMDFDSLWVSRIDGNDSVFIITPPNTLANDTLVNYTFTLVDENGCTFDTTVAIMVYAHKHVDLYDTVYNSELPHLWEGLTFNSAGCQDTLLHTVHGADSVVTLHLSVIYPYDTAICVNKTPIVWHNQTFSSTSTVTVSQHLECADSIEVLNVVVNPVFRDTLSQTVCENQLPFQWRGGEYHTANTYYDSLVSTVTGCDSIYVLQLTVNPVFHRTVPVAVCDNELPFEWNGRYYDTTGMYLDTLAAVTGCDSIVMLALVVNPTYNQQEAATICDSELPYTWRDTVFQPGTATGSYVFHRETIHGCDSMVTLSLVVNPTYNQQEAATICDSELPYTWRDTVFQSGTETGSYIFHRETVHGCDSTVTLSLVVNPTYDQQETATICDSELPYTWRDTVFQLGTGTGSFVFHRETVHGCDSTVTLSLVVNQTYEQQESATICDSELPYTWRDTVFQLGTATGSFVFHRETVHGCDSTVTLSLVVNPTYDQQESATICDSELPYTWRDTVFQPGTATGSFVFHRETVHGCDSTVTLALTVNKVFQSIFDTVICANDIPFFWHNHQCDTTGVYYDSLVNPITLCDSIYVLSLTVSPSYNQYETQGICQSDLPYQWRDTLFLEGTETGDYVFHDTTAFGCDSIVTLHLMVSEIAFGDTLATACDSFVWRGVTYFETPIENPTDTLYGGSTSGCDSVTVLQLTISHSVSTVDTVTICEGELPYSYYDTLFEVGTLSGDYVFHNTAACGCDSVTNLHLYVNQNVHTTQVPFIICESMLPAVWHVPGASHPIPAGTTGDTIIVDTFHLAANGCDSIVTRRLIIGPSTDTTIVDTVVQNQLPYTLNGKQYNATGIYHDTTMNIAGCDSIITLDLTVFFNVATTLDSTVCSNLLPFSWNGVSFTGADTQSVVLTASSGADSTVEMRLHVMEIPDVTISGPSVLCPDDSATLTAVTTTAIAYLWSTGDTTSSITVYAAGSYTVTVSNEYGCTQTTSLELSGTFVGNPIESFHSSGLCAGNDYLFGWASATNPSTNVTSVAIEGPWVTAIGDTAFLFAPPDTLGHDTLVSYSFHLQNQYGCSHDTTVYLTVYVLSHTVIDTAVCDSILWNGAVYSQTGIFTDTLTNSAGCDSVVTLHLTVNHSSVTYDTLHLLENQLPYYLEAADITIMAGSEEFFQFSYTLSSQSNCDSVIMESVYIHPNYFLAYDTMVCSSALPLVWHGRTFTATSSFTDSLLTVYGSDSVLTYTVTVDNLAATIGNVTHINCFGESTGAASVTVTGGVTPLVYQWTGAAGTPISTTTQIANRPAGQYTFTVTDAAGCSVTVSVTLNTLHGEMLPGSITASQSVCYGDTLGIVSGTAATGDDCVYQWQMSSDGAGWAPLSGNNNTQNYLFQTPTTEPFHLRRAWISAVCGTLYSDTLDIAVWPVSADSIHDAICAGNPYQDHGFDLSETETATPGTLTSVLHYSTIHGCDSSVTLVLDIYEPQTTEFEVEICEGEGYYGNGFSILPLETVGADTLLRTRNLQTVDGCDSIVQLEVTVIDTALQIVSPTLDFCEEMSAELMAVSNMPDYEWSTGELTPNITVTAPGLYSVTASQGGCSVTAQYAIEPCVFQLYLPNAITPGRGDGLNDVFCLSEHAKSGINLFEISILNRWGEQVFYSNDKNFQWDGEYRGQVHHQVVYNYIIEYTDSAGRRFRVTGSLTVL